MKKINSMDYLLVFGTIILFCSGIALMCNDYFDTYLIKSIGIITLGVILYMLSLIFKYILKIDKSFKVANVLGSISLIIGYIIAGATGVFGEWFSINGDGVQLFLASVALLIMLLSILTAVLTKVYYYINITFIAIMLEIFHLLIYFNLSYQVSLIIVGIIITIINLFKINKYIYNYSDFSTFAYIILTLIFGFSSNHFLLGSIVFGVASISLLSALAKRKSIWIELVSLISFLALIVQFSNYDINIGLFTVILAFVICLFEIIVNTFKLVKTDAFSVISKLLNFFIIIAYVYDDGISLVSQVVVFIFLGITAVCNSYIIKHDTTEKYLLPLKLCFITGGLYDCLASISAFTLTETYLFIINALIYLLIYKVLKKKNKSENIAYLVISLIWSLLAVSFVEGRTIEFVLANLLLLVNYSVLRFKYNVAINRLIYSLIVFMFLMLGHNVDFILMIFQIAVMSILTFISRKDKYNFGISIFVLYLLFKFLLDIIIVNGPLSDILSSIVFLSLVGISSEVLFSSATSKNTFASILITLNLVFLLENSTVFIVNIYSLIVSLIIILVALKNSNYKALYYIGLIMGGLNLISLIRFLDGLPVAVYLLMIAIVLIVGVSIMVYRYQHRVVKKPKVVPLDVINYCPECGVKVNTGEIFCGNCGTKVK